MNPPRLSAPAPRAEQQDRHLKVVELALLPEFHELHCAAAADGHVAQDAASEPRDALAVEESRRRQALVTDANLGPCSHVHDAAVGAN